ncbi:hypothetical protein ACN47E_007284 [Coniothyrium glycines]
MPSTTYTTLLLPKHLAGPSLTRLANKLRDFKLHALQTDPKAFSLEYSSESPLPISVWEQRITVPGSQILVCIATNPPSIAEAAPTSDMNEAQLRLLLSSEWTCIFTMIGPVSHAEWIFPKSDQPYSAPDVQETRWQLTSLFVLPTHRGRGLAKKITLAAIEYGSTVLVDDSSRVGRGLVRFRLIVHPDNRDVAVMYSNMGFVDCARYTLREAYIANGDAKYIPAGAEAGKWDTRVGIGMEYLVRHS